MKAVVMPNQNQMISDLLELHTKFWWKCQIATYSQYLTAETNLTFCSRTLLIHQLRRREWDVYPEHPRCQNRYHV